MSRFRNSIINEAASLFQVYLTKHYRNRRLGDPDFVLDFEEIYVLDSKTKSISRAKVLVRVLLFLFRFPNVSLRFSLYCIMHMVSLSVPALYIFRSM